MVVVVVLADVRADFVMLQLDRIENRADCLEFGSKNSRVNYYNHKDRQKRRTPEEMIEQ